MIDRWNLERFVIAQNADGIYERAVGELQSGHKSSHWMWFVFPQLGGLGSSWMSRRYAISGIEEATDYLRHHVLGPRLLHVSRVVVGLTGRSVEQIFGSVDARKLRSSSTLFHRAAPDEPIFRQLLDDLFGGRPDPETDRRLQTSDEPA